MSTPQADPLEGVMAAVHAYDYAPDELHEVAALRNLVQQASRALDERLVRVADNGATHDAIAAVLRITRQAVSARIQRARLLLEEPRPSFAFAERRPDGSVAIHRVGGGS